MTRRWFSFLVLFFLLLPAPARADRLDEVIARIAPYAEKGMREAQVPGMAIAVVHGGKTVWAKGFGTRRAGADLPVTPDTAFQVGSTTKAFTVALMATLVDKDEADWDAPVSDLYPAFAMYDPWVTREFLVHDLFAQHSGLPPYAGDLQLFLGYDRDHVLRSLRDIPPVYSFRDRFSYVNNLFMMAGRVEEELTGKSWETLMRERILTPLGMTRSSVDAAGLAGAADASELHRLVGGRPEVIGRGSILYTWPYVAGPAGGLNASANDMAKWIALQLGRGQSGEVRIFSEASADYMREPRTPIMMGEQHGAYCQGWMRTEMRRTDVIWHNGGTSGICSFAGYSPALDAGIVVLTNLSDNQVADAVGFEFFDLLSGVDDADWIAEFRQEAEQDAAQADADSANASRAEASRAAPAPALPGLAPARYAGDYDNAVLGPLSVRENKDGLTIRFGEGGRFEVKARHETMHVFVGDWPELNPDYPSLHFDFQVDGDGMVTGVLLREYDDDGCALFNRYE